MRLTCSKWPGRTLPLIEFGPTQVIVTTLNDQGTQDYIAGAVWMGSASQGKAARANSSFVGGILHRSEKASRSGEFFASRVTASLHRGGMIRSRLGVDRGALQAGRGQSSKAVRFRCVALSVRSCSSWLVRTRCAFGSVRFEPVRWLRIAYPAGEPLPGWLSAQRAQERILSTRGLGGPGPLSCRGCI